MPEISRLFGIVIKMFLGEHNSLWLRNKSTYWEPRMNRRGKKVGLALRSAFLSQRERPLRQHW